MARAFLELIEQIQQYGEAKNVRMSDEKEDTSLAEANGLVYEHNMNIARMQFGNLFESFIYGLQDILTLRDIHRSPTAVKQLQRNYFLGLRHL